MNLIDHHIALLFLTIIIIWILTYLIHFLYEGYESRMRIRTLKSRGIVSYLNKHKTSCLD